MKLLKYDKELIISQIDLNLDSFHNILWVKYVLIVGTLKVCSIQFGGGFPSCLLEVWDTDLDQTTENFSQEYRESWTPDPLLPMRTLKQIHSHSIWSVRDIYHWVQISVSLEGFRNWISTAWHWWSWTCVGSTWDFDVPPPAQFCVGHRHQKFGRTGWAVRQDDGTSKSKSIQPRSVTTSVTL